MSLSDLHRIQRHTSISLPPEHLPCVASASLAATSAAILAYKCTMDGISGTAFRAAICQIEGSQQLTCRAYDARCTMLSGMGAYNLRIMETSRDNIENPVERRVLAATMQ